MLKNIFNFVAIYHLQNIIIFFIKKIHIILNTAFGEQHYFEVCCVLLYFSMITQKYIFSTIVD